MGTRQLVIMLVAGLLLLACVAHVEAKTVAVSIKNNAFNPKETTISVGDTITWTNDDAMLHDVDLDDMGKSPEMHKGETFSKTFDKAGTFSYDCDIHPFMKGSVIVK